MNSYKTVITNRVSLNHQLIFLQAEMQSTNDIGIYEEIQSTKKLLEVNEVYNDAK